MSQAEALLNRMAMSGAYTATQETEPHITIGPDRVINVPDVLKRLAVQFDHNIETVTFDCPRYWDDADMSEMSVYINYKRNDKYIGSFMAENVVVDEIDQSMMHFDWRISKNVTMVSGPLQFLVCIKKIAEEEEEIHWNSEIYDDCYISEGMEYGEVLQDTYPDVLAQLQRDNQESMAAVKKELLDAKANGEFNPVTRVESVTGGYRVYILVGAEEQYIELMHGSTPVIQALVEQFLQIRSAKPTSGPALWLDSADGESGTLYFMNKSGVSTPIYPTTKLDNVDGLEDLIAHMGSKQNPHEVTAIQTGAIPNTSFSIGATNGIAFVGGVPGLTSLKPGMKFTFDIKTTSATVTPSLNITGIGSYPIYRRVAGTVDGYTEGPSATWLKANTQVTMTFAGDKWLADVEQPDVSDVKGVLAPEHGGTGTDSWEARGLVYARAMNRLGQIPATKENGSVLMQDNNGDPHWASLSSQIDEFGALRFKSGSYTGQGNAGNRDLGVTPRVLFVRDSTLTERGGFEWLIFLQGHQCFDQSESIDYNTPDGQPITTRYRSTVTLTGSTLVFSGSVINGPGGVGHYLLNGTARTYDWFALY